MGIFSSFHSDSCLCQSCEAERARLSQRQQILAELSRPDGYVEGFPPLEYSWQIHEQDFNARQARRKESQYREDINEEVM